MPSKTGPRIESTSWGIHRIIRIGGVPYALMQEWELWYTGSTYKAGHAALESIPSGNTKLVPLHEMVDDESVVTVMENIEQKS